LDASSKRYHSKLVRNVLKFTSRPSTAGSASVLGSPPQDTATISSPNQANRPKWDDKLVALRSQRRAQGLCMKCGGKWVRNHKCPNQVPLHILEVFLEAMNVNDTGELDQE